MENKTKNNETIILHDTFLYKGGGERLIIMMGKILKSDIASGFFDKNSFDLRREGFNGKKIALSSPIFKSGLRHIKLKLAFILKTNFLYKYNNVLFSGDCITAVRNCNKNAKKIYYCHTPPRYIFDQYKRYYDKVPIYLKPIYTILIIIFRILYKNDIKKMDLIITNSKNTQRRINKYLGVESQVLYPPVDTKEFKFISQEGYYLSFARLSEIKRVDRIIKAFMNLPNKKLIVIYGKNDPQKDLLLYMGSKFKNIEFITLEDNSKLKDYIGKCIATIYIPLDEDFGMSPVESMAAGKPVIGVDDGGLKETIINKKTGLLINKVSMVSDIIDAVNKMTPELALSMRKDCEERAKEFSLDKFEVNLNNIIKNIQ